MEKQYKQLMQQQNIGSQTAQAFFEKLDSTPVRRKNRWSAVLAAACLCLVIPVTALAVEYLFGVSNVRIGEASYAPGAEGYHVRLENVESHPLDAFSEELQALQEDKVVYYDSWAEAEAMLGIDLLDNTVLENEANPIDHYLARGSHCMGVYRTLDGRFHTASTVAAFQKDRVSFEVKANVAAEQGGKDSDLLPLFHGASVAYSKKYGANITSEAYTTRAGIPATVLTVELEHLTEVTALFAVDGVSYEVRVLSKHTREKSEKEVLLEVLDGFVLE